MKQKTLTFGKDCINKNAFHKKGKPVSIDEVDIRKSMLSSIYSYVNKVLFKYFIRYINENDPFLALSCIKLSQMNACVKYFNRNS